MASKRGYLTQAELAQYADITITDTTEADDQISQAEEMIDSFVGAQDKFFSDFLDGKATSGTQTSLTLDSRYSSNYPYLDYFVGMTVEILGGTNSGDRKKVSASSILGVLTTEAFTSAIDSTSFYRIYQLGKFPRYIDTSYNSVETPPKYYKSIPEAVKRAVAAQVEYVIQMGTKFFSTDAAEKNAESIGDYSYSKGRQGTSSSQSLIAPKARILLRGIKNNKGQMIF